MEINEAEKILDKFKERYIDKIYPERLLFINHLNRYDKIISFEQLNQVNIPEDKTLLIFHERLKTVYYTTFKQICLYVDQLEPWEEIDCLIFDEELSWFLGLNHNEKAILFNIKQEKNSGIH
jgi:hypothetical protein